MLVAESEWEDVVMLDGRGAHILGIRELTADPAGRRQPIDEVLEDLPEPLRDHLTNVLRAKDSFGKFSVPRDEIIEACAEDGYAVTDWSIRVWRRRNADR